ncbi:MAG: hypothetical protein ABIJ82_02050 [Patescibacteria group bacterium]|nr:hypothetical protein [Patescibacteria group bacterium]MBU1952721.1 hypothetical protein [Patescibacteria group bacterium]
MNYPYKTLESISKEKFLGTFSNSVTAIYLDIPLKMMSARTVLEKFLLVQAGFAVDLAVGYVTREHDDLDLTTLVADIPTFKEIFHKANFEVATYPNTDPSLSFYAHTFIQDIQKDINIDVVGIDISGDDVIDRKVSGGEKFIFPIKASELVWERKIGEVPVQFFSPYLVYKFKKMQQKRDVVMEKNEKDFDILEKFYPQLKSSAPNA